MEFGETPSSSLTLQEFMTVDLEEEQDPPSYKAARIKDRERLKMLENKDSLKQLSRIQMEIEKHILEKRHKKSAIGDVETTNDEEGDMKNFVSSSTVDILEELEDEDEIAFGEEKQVGLGPSTAVMGLEEGSEKETEKDKDFVYEGDGELDLEGLDDKELDMYIMTEVETKRKDAMWTKRNADYLQKQKEKEEKLKKELEEGKPPEKKKKRATTKKKNTAPANTAGEAIEKMLQEKKISTKINYDVLKSLTFNLKDNQSIVSDISLKAEIVPKEEVLGIEKSPDKKPQVQDAVSSKPEPAKVKQPVTSKAEPLAVKQAPLESENSSSRIDDCLDDEDEPEAEENEINIAEMLNRHRGDDDEDYYGGYDDDDY